jgi:protein TonB
MPPAAGPHSSYLGQASLRSRAAAFVLALAIVALLVFMLIELGALPALLPPPPRNPISFDLLPGSPITATHARAKARRASARRAPPSRGVPHHAAPTHIPPPPFSWNMVTLTPEEYAASDIAKLPSHHDEAAHGDQATAEAGSGADSGAGPGDGPGGERLYDAEWYVRPTHAQLAYYMPSGPPRAGWGMIACRMIAGYRVEDCREIGESPGSGFARTLREAAWQFRVVPTRIGNRQLVGTWVRIRFDFTLDPAP